jgi:hypothetical protein
VATAIGAVTSNVDGVKRLVEEVCEASAQQSQGISQVAQAIQQMEQVTQRTAASAEESAATSEELDSQVEQTMGLVAALESAVGRRAPRGAETASDARTPRGDIAPLHRSGNVLRLPPTGSDQSF